QYFKRNNFRANVTSQITDWLQIGGNLSYSNAKQNTSGASRALVFTTTMQSPYLRNVDNTDWEHSLKSGERMFDFGSYSNNFFGIQALNNGGDYWDNPNDESFNNNLNNMIASRFFAEFTLPYNLKFKSALSIDNNIDKFFGYGSAIHDASQQAPYGITVTTNGGNATRNNLDKKSVTFNNILSWEQSFGSHN